MVHSETDALLLENDYIKQFRPKYNVLLRDDKSYPYIFLSGHRHPRLAYHRGVQRQKGEYFGPYPNSSAVRQSLHLMQNFSLSVNVKIHFIALVLVLVCSIRLNVV